MEKINVSQEKCIGCGACVAIDPEHFEFNEDGKSSVISNDNLESENLINAIESCPTSAIEKSEEIENSLNITCENEDCDCDNCDCDNCECEDCDCSDECDCDDCCCEECESQDEIEIKEEN